MYWGEHGDAYLFVDSQDGNAILAAFREGLGVQGLRLVLALAIKGDRLGSLALGEEDKAVDAIADLNRKLREFEGWSRLEQEDLASLVLLTLRNQVLRSVSICV